MEYYRIALVSRPHGVKGGIKLHPLTDNTSRFKGLTEAFLEVNGTYTPIEITSVSVTPDAVFATFKGVDTREQAEAIRDAYIAVDKAHAVKLPEGQYFIADLIGCEVVDTNDVVYGKLTEVLETGANDVYVVRGAKNAMVPALKRVLSSVDVAAKRIVLDASVVEEVVLFED